MNDRYYGIFTIRPPGSPEPQPASKSEKALKLMEAMRKFEEKQEKDNEDNDPLFD